MTATAAVIGAGPAGMMAAEVLATAGVAVTVYDHMPSPGRKLLMAGRGGLNLTHAEPLPALLSRYGDGTTFLTPFIEAFPPSALIAWCHALGQETFIGSSQRVFPRAMKASPLLRAWLNRLTTLGVIFRPRYRWLGWTDHGGLHFDPTTETPLPTITILALGGASWPRLGSDAQWTSLFPELVRDFLPSNCGFAITWSDHIRTRFVGQPLKRITIGFRHHTAGGDAIITARGIEGTPIYALSGPLRDAIAERGSATVSVDLRPDLNVGTIKDRLAHSGRLSIGNTLRRRIGLSPPAASLVLEALHNGADPATLPTLIKSLPLRLEAPLPIGRAISSAGGIRLDAVTNQLMLRDRPGVFVAGEMLDWEAPTGGYLLQACFSTGVAAAKGAVDWIAAIPDKR